MQEEEITELHGLLKCHLPNLMTDVFFEFFKQRFRERCEMVRSEINSFVNLTSEEKLAYIGKLNERLNVVNGLDFGTFVRDIKNMTVGLKNNSEPAKDNVADSGPSKKLKIIDGSYVFE